jgi:hypothetical protein
MFFFTAEFMLLAPSPLLCVPPLPAEDTLIALSDGAGGVTKPNKKTRK